MRIWDIHPGYLNRQSLLGEHRELHGIVSIIVNGKKGYSKHPETLRWLQYNWALKMRHQLLVAEMSLRNFQHKSPVTTLKNPSQWPPTYIDAPAQQFQILDKKYQEKERGRIPLPQNAQQLWRQHKYSLMARDVTLYEEIGRKVAEMSPRQDFSSLCLLLTEQLRTPPTEGGIRNALQHMWGYVADDFPVSKKNMENWSLPKLFATTQKAALTKQQTYLLHSTALSELGAWM